ncbi:Stringent starvation protein A [Shimia sp. SK013]|uniref:glutathione S-transferase family protein n=1 Tax=Shimia sp. SK013 TaxID=1389006 RepID=UPI0006B40D39|nr:glutathione S-transferase family protein [Shimia sp. SK013]KPA21774.1 Stringent starvation protein A [Shimia sp. SK013]
MAVITPTNTSVQELNGLHLYHGDMSNCSMRVRMTLIEKGLDWTSHHIDLKKKENISEEYFGINPNGLVPTLVHDGVVHIESNDIIDYLDNTFPHPSLRALDNNAEMMEWLHLAAAIHLPAIKPYVYATKIAKHLKKTREEQAQYDALQANDDLKEFHAKHKGSRQFSDEDVGKAQAILAECHVKLETALQGQDWIMGEQFTLADISWIPLYHVLLGCGYAYDTYPNIQRWAAALQEKPSFQQGVLKWCPDFSKV